MTNETEKQQEMEKVVPSRNMTSIEDMQDWLEQAMPRGWMHRWGRPTWGELTRSMESTTPRVDVVDRDNEILVRAEVPGVKKEDLDISVTDTTVTIKGSTKREEKEEKGDYYRCEIASGAFARTVSLPASVDTDKAKASFEDGVLDLLIPKISKTRRRSIKLD